MFVIARVELNLQSMCHHSINLDSPINNGQAKQATGRVSNGGADGLDSVDSRNLATTRIVLTVRNIRQ